MVFGKVNSSLKGTIGFNEKEDHFAKNILLNVVKNVQSNLVNCIEIFCWFVF